MKIWGRVAAVIALVVAAIFLGAWSARADSTQPQQHTCHHGVIMTFLDEQGNGYADCGDPTPAPPRCVVEITSQSADLTSVTVHLKLGVACEVALHGFSTQGSTWATSGNQTLVDYDAVTLTHDRHDAELSITNPSVCWQNDLTMPGQHSLIPHYPDAKFTGLLAHANGGTEGCGETTPTPTPTPTPTITPTPTVTVTPTPTETRTCDFTPPATYGPAEPKPAPDCHVCPSGTTETWTADDKAFLYITCEPQPTPSPSVTVKPTVTATPVVAPSPSPGPTLPFTGSDTVPLLILGGCLLALGGGAVAFARKR